MKGGSPSPSKFRQTTTNVQSGFDAQKTRIQITSDWKDACIDREIVEIQKLEKFVQEERARSHAVAESLLKKQEELDKRHQNLIQFRKEQAIEKKERNKEMAAKAGFKAAELVQGSMAQYEEKQALIIEKEKQREAERIAKNKAKEEAF